MINPFWTIRTGRLILQPVSGADLPDLRALKADPLVYAVMLGGVRSWVESAEELATDIAFWGANGVGMWTVRDALTNAFRGTTGLHTRPDGRGIALRFAFVRDAQRQGYASEAAGAALRFGHERAHIPLIVAAARQSNVASRLVLGGIGMVIAERFDRHGDTILLYESRAREF
jgi:RimJ/RimL family protein N-acetyltransferase